MLWQQLYRHEGKSDGQLSIVFPKDTLEPISATYNPDDDRSFRSYARKYDQRDLKEIPQTGFGSRGSSQPFETLSLGQQIIRMNFDIHVGSIGGLGTKILAAFVSLVGASLPVTGFIIWYNRKWGKKKRPGRLRKPS